MNWDAIGAIAELLAAIGVIVSLVYLASQIRHSREQMGQNTRAIESQATWAHWNAVYNIYHARAANAELFDLHQTFRSWDEDQVAKLVEAFAPEFQRARYVVGTEVGFWQARYFTQTTPEERTMLESHIALNADSPIYRHYVETIPHAFYRAEFREFLRRVLREAN